MDTWETSFREKSMRRWTRHAREKIVRRGILALLLAGVAAAAAMMVAGVPR